jgi:uncharacterized protein involved in exopolysaccharide biosynthesis
MQRLEEHNNLSEELTLKDLIVSVREYGSYFISKWYVFLIVAVVAGGGAAYLESRKKVLFLAPLTFTVEGKGSSGIGNGSILGQLGLGNAQEESSAMKVLELSRSRLVLAGPLFDSLIVDGVEDVLANHLIHYYQYHEKWEEDLELTNFRFNGKKPEKDDIVGNKVLKQLHRLIAGPPLEKALFSLNVNENTGIFLLESSTLSPDISVFLANSIYSNLEDVYVNSSIRRHKETFNLLSERADSVEALLNVSENKLAREQDRSSRVSLRSNGLQQQKLRREVLILSTMFAEVLKNKEAASFLLANEKPTFVKIDKPLEPLQISAPSVTRSALVGGILGLLLTSVVLFFWKVIKAALSENLEDHSND